MHQRSGRRELEPSCKHLHSGRSALASSSRLTFLTISSPSINLGIYFCQLNGSLCGRVISPVLGHVITRLVLRRHCAVVFMRFLLRETFFFGTANQRACCSHSSGEGATPSCEPTGMARGWNCGCQNCDRGAARNVAFCLRIDENLWIDCCNIGT